MSTKAIQCPKCGAGYKVRADMQGRVQCKKCTAVIEIGVSQAQRKGATTRNKKDQQMAVKLLVVCGVALLAIAGIIAAAGGTSSGTKRPPLDGSSAKPGFGGSGGGLTAAEVQRIEELERMREATRTTVHRVGERYLEALAANDAEAVKDSFMFREYFEGTSKRLAKLKPELAARYDFEAATAEQRIAMIEDGVKGLLDPTLCEYVKSQLLPALERNPKATLSSAHVELEERNPTAVPTASLLYVCSDAGGEPLLELGLSLQMDSAFDKTRDGPNEKAWRIIEQRVKWLQPGFGGEDADKRGIDAIAGRTEQREKESKRAARRSGGTGLPEADPTVQSAVPGTTDDEVNKIGELIRVLTSNGGIEVNRARYDLIDNYRKKAIPFLLNEFIGLDHGSNEDDIQRAFVIHQALREITGHVTERIQYRPMTRGDLDSTLSGDRKSVV